MVRKGFDRGTVCRTTHDCASPHHHLHAPINHTRGGVPGSLVARRPAVGMRVRASRGGARDGHLVTCTRAACRVTERDTLIPIAGDNML